MIHNLSNGEIYDDSLSIGLQTQSFKDYYYSLVSGSKIEAESVKESIGNSKVDNTELFRYTREVYNDSIIKVTIDKTYQESPSGRRALAIANNGIICNIEIL